MPHDANEYGWAVQITKAGGPEVLQRVDMPRIAPGPRQVEIAVKAAGVNFADVSMRLGLYTNAPPLPYVPGYEVAGEIVRVGEHVTHLKVGDAVMAATYFGGYATHVCVSEDKALPLPPGIDFVTGAGIPIVFITALLAIQEMGRVRSGDHVLIHGIAGGVGLAALQVAKQAGAIVYGTASSEEKLAYATSMGLDIPINYGQQDFVSAIRQRAGERPLDLILDPVGGKNIAKNLSLLRPTGKTVIIGASDMITGEKANLFRVLRTFLAMRKLDLLSLFKQNSGVFCLDALQLWHEDALLNRLTSQILAGFAAGTYHTKIAQTFPLLEAGEAHRYLQNRRNIGKVVLTV